MRPDLIPPRSSKVLTDIQTLAQFRPNPSMPESKWWFNELTKATR